MADNKHGGKRPGAGRKSKFSEEALEQMLDSAWPKKDRLKATGKIAARANAGDLEAYKLLMAYCYGKPKEKHELTGKDGKDLTPVLNITFEGAEPTPTEETDAGLSEPSD